MRVRRRKRMSLHRGPVPHAAARNQHWSMDFLWSAQFEQALGHGGKRLAFIYPASVRVDYCNPGHHGETTRFRPD